MSIDEAKEILEGIGLLDQVTDDLIQASGVVLEALEAPTATMPLAGVPQEVPPTEFNWSNLSQAPTQGWSAGGYVVSQQPTLSRNSIYPTWIPPQEEDGWI